MKRSGLIRNILVGLAFAIALISLEFGEFKNMSLFRSQPVYKWQGTADREPSSYMAVKVLAIQPKRTGLFGIGNSPSVDGYYPDARGIRAVRLDDAVKIRIEAPLSAVPDATSPGTRLTLVMVDDKHFIRMIRAPEGLQDGHIEGWASQAP